MFEGCRQVLGRLHPQFFQRLSPRDDVALAGGQAVSRRVPGLLSLVEAEANFLERFGEANQLIIKIPGLFGNG